MTSRGRLLTSTVLFGTLSMALVGTQAQAQQSADADLQEIVVTGSRIKSPNATSDSPVLTVGNQELKFQGTTNVEQLLNHLPGITASQGSTVSNGSDGTAGADLRGLGRTRTLVLIDGKRVGPGDPGSASGSGADLNFIPAALVEGIDVLTGGASAIYGSDAVAGVVNFKIRRDLEGVMFDYQFNVAQHDQGNNYAQGMLKNAPYKTTMPGSQFDGFVRDATMAIGVNAPNNKGNITVYAEVRNTDPVLSSTRDWSSCPAQAIRGGGAAGTLNALQCQGSGTGAYGNFTTNAGENLALNPDGSGSFVPFTTGLKYNFSPTNYLQRQDERYSGGAFAHYEVSKHLDVYTDVMFMRDHTVAQIAPSGLFIGGGPTGTLQVPCNYQYLSAAEVSSICQDVNGNPMSVYQADGVTPNIATLNTMPGLRFASLPRQDDITHTDFRILTGARGDIDGNWSYDASGSYYESIYSEHYNNDVSFTRVQDSLLGCKSGNPGCVPIDIFHYGNLTPAMLKYVAVPGEKTGNTQEIVVDGNISGNLAPYGGTSPFATNPIATNFGIQYRRDSLSLVPDAEFQSGDLMGQGASTPQIGGGIGVVEEYAEIKVPLVEDKPFVKSFSLDGAFRHSDYSIDDSDGGSSTNAWKLGVDYAPVDDVRFRGGYNRAARAPSIYELVFPTSLGNDSGYTDPCAGANPTASLAQCQLTGVKASQYGKIQDCPANQCEAQSGGNLALKPEVADTWTWGTVFTPTFLPGFTTSIDYWDVNVSNYITSLTGPNILNGCMSGTAAMCDLIHRNSVTGVIFGSAGYLQETTTNIGSLHRRGLDFAVNYTKDLADFGLDHAGSLTADFNGTYLIGAVTTTTEAYDCAGLYGSVCGAPAPTWRHNLRLTWSSPWQADFSVFWRHIGGVGLDTNTSNPVLSNGVIDNIDGKIGSYDYIDLATSVSLYDHYRINFGVNNITDKDPPVISQGAVPNGWGSNGNTWSGTYDVLGRTFFLNLHAEY